MRMALDKLSESVTEQNRIRECEKGTCRGAGMGRGGDRWEKVDGEWSECISCVSCQMTRWIWKSCWGNKSQNVSNRPVLVTRKSAVCLFPLWIFKYWTKSLHWQGSAFIIRGNMPSPVEQILSSAYVQYHCPGQQQKTTFGLPCAVHSQTSCWTLSNCWTELTRWPWNQIH